MSRQSMIVVSDKRKGALMKEITGESAGQTRETAAQDGGLAQRYGQIGISAVAAAARYHLGAAKNLFQTPAALAGQVDRGAAR